MAHGVFVTGARILGGGSFISIWPLGNAIFSVVYKSR